MAAWLLPMNQILPFIIMIWCCVAVCLCDLVTQLLLVYDDTVLILLLLLVLLQVGILLRELCRLHNVPLPPDIDNLTIPFQLPPPNSSSSLNQQPAAQHQIEDIESDQDDIEDPIGDSEQESEADEDLPLEMDDGRSTNKVRSCILTLNTNNSLVWINFGKFVDIYDGM